MGHLILLYGYIMFQEREELIVNETGVYDGSKLVSVGVTRASPDIHYISVDADVNW